jgi:hypothetical protein
MRYAYIFILLLVNIVFSQQSTGDLTGISNHFGSFDYKAVIRIGDSLLTATETFDTTSRIELLRMKGISHYTLREQNEAQGAFLAILDLDRHYTMDPFTTPPKILAFYNIIKKSFNSSILQSEKTVQPGPSVSYRRGNISGMAAMVGRSVLVPGWGHLKAGQKSKGRWILTGTLATLPAALYFTLDSNIKEKKYLSETDRNRIGSRYSDFNRAYKLRNTFLVAYAGIWLYSQFDLLKHLKFASSTSLTLSETPEKTLRFSLHVAF